MNVPERVSGYRMIERRTMWGRCFADVGGLDYIYQTDKEESI